MCSSEKRKSVESFVVTGNYFGECVSNLVDLGMRHAKLPTGKILLTINNFRKLRNEISTCSCLRVLGQ